MAGKGDKRRPAQVPREKVDENYDRIFKPDKRYHMNHGPDGCENPFCREAHCNPEG